MKQGRLLLSERSIKSVRFDTGVVAYGCINALFEEECLDIPIEKVEDLVEKVARRLDNALNANDSSMYSVKVNLIHSKEFKVKWRPKERCFEYMHIHGGASGIIEESSGKSTAVSLFFVKPLKKTHGYPRQHRAAIIKQYRAEAILYTRAVPIFREIVEKYISDSGYIEDTMGYLKTLLREELMDLSECFIDEAMKKIAYHP